MWYLKYQLKQKWSIGHLATFWWQVEVPLNQFAEILIQNQHANVCNSMRKFACYVLMLWWNGLKFAALIFALINVSLYLQQRRLNSLEEVYEKCRNSSAREKKGMCCAMRFFMEHFSQNKNILYFPSYQPLQFGLDDYDSGSHTTTWHQLLPCDSSLWLFCDFSDLCRFASANIGSYIFAKYFFMLWVR